MRIIKLILFLLLTSIINISSWAQNTIVVSETIENVGDESGNALRTVIFRADEKAILKAWKSVLKNHEADVKTKGGEMYGTEVLISSISDHKMSVFMKMKDLNKTSKEVFFIFKKTEDILSSGNDISGYTSAKEIILNFATEVSKKATVEYFESERKKLEKLVNEFETLARDKKKSEKDIEVCKESITDNEYKIQENLKNQKIIHEEIEKQKKSLRIARDAKDVFK
jgi:hypothetical protein